MLLENLKLKITSNLDSESLSFSYPPKPELGDLSLPCFKLAEEKGDDPFSLAKKIALKLENKQELKKYFSSIKAQGPYVNFFISRDYLAQELINKIKKEKSEYGYNKDGHNRRVMIEYSNANTHKEYHIGHLRNISYGDAINHLLTCNGYQALPVSYINDFGIHVAKTIWNWYRDPVYQERPESKGYLLGRCYTKASKYLEKHPDKKEEVGKIMKEIESRQGKNYEFWKESRQWSIDYFSSIYKDLDIKFEHIFYESEIIKQGLEIVKNLLSQGVLVKSQGAIIADLEKYSLGVLPVLRSDGTALYAVADLALASEKFNDFDLDESIYVVDIRQSLYFKQLFKILELAGYNKKMVHLTYDFVTLPEGMMSSRTGNVITYHKLKEEISARLILETKSRHNKWSQKKIDKIVKNLTSATIKFEMLKINADKIITFDIDRASKFEGYTACYIQYTYARLQSIINKSSLFKFWNRKADLNNLEKNIEKEILIKLAKYPELIKESLKKYNPSEITKYLFELAQLANDYYQEVNILKSKNKIKKARLELISALSQVLDNGFKVLGIKVLKKM